MQSDQLSSFLKLNHIFGLGRVSLQRLGQHFNGDFSHIFAASPAELRTVGLNTQQINQISQPDIGNLERDLTMG